MALVYGSIGFNNSLDLNSKFSQIKAACDHFRRGTEMGQQKGKHFFAGFNTAPLDYTEFHQTGDKEFLITASYLNTNRLRSHLSHDENVAIDSIGLIADAYKKIGVELFLYLDGDWLIVINDNATGKSFVGRDCTGNTGCYYTVDSNAFSYCSSIHGLIGQLPKVQPNIEYLDKYLLDLYWEKDDFAIKGVKFIPPGYYIEIDSGQVCAHQYWSVDALAVDDTLDASQFLDRYKTAVEARVEYSKNFNLGATLSGGLDSSSVSCLAANYLRQLGKGPLKTYTSIASLVDEVQLNPSNLLFFNEEHLARQICAFNGHMLFHPINGTKVGVVNSIKEDVKSHLMPVHAPGNSYWFQEMSTLAQKQGVDVLLNGQFGNLTVSWGDYSFSFFKKLRMSSVKLMKLVIKIALLPVWLQFGKQTFQRDRFKFIKGRSGFTKQLIADVFRGAVFVLRKDLDKKKYLYALGARLSGNIWQDTSFKYAMNSLDPTSDRQLLEYCFQLKPSSFSSERLNRKLIRDAMKGILPDIVRFNEKIGVQGIDNLQRLKTESEELLNKLNEWGEDAFLASNYNIDLFLSYLNDISNAEDEVEYLTKGQTLLRFIALGLFVEELRTYAKRENE